MPHDHIVWLSQIGRQDEPTVGAKAADLGELTAMRLPVPHGFVIETTAYYTFLQTTGLRAKLEALLSPNALADPKQVQAVSKHAHSLIVKATMPEPAARAIGNAYHHLSSKDIFVAVRASLPDSQQGINHPQPGILNVLGQKSVVATIQKVWADLWSPANIQACYEQNISPLSLGVAVVVQRMLEPESAGILFTQDPISNDPNHVSIEAVWGLGEPVMSGQLIPDHYQVDRRDWTVVNQTVARQDWQLVRKPGRDSRSDDHNVQLPISADWQRRPKLEEHQVVELAKLAVSVEGHFGYAQDCEWAYADKQFYLVQTRPVPGLITSSQPRVEIALDQHKSTPLLSGTAAAPGWASGPVRIVRSRQDVAKLKPGEVMVAQDTDPNFDQALHKAAAVVVAIGSLASHAAAMSRQLAIPAIVEAGSHIDLLHNGEVVTVDGLSGHVYAGALHVSDAQIVVTTGNAGAQYASPQAETLPLASVGNVTSTATKVALSLNNPFQAEEWAESAADGVGQLRAEFVLAELDEHPLSLINRGQGEVLSQKLYDGLMTVAKAFNNRPVMYRPINFTSAELRRLSGGKDLEISESNPSLGYRGATRIVADSRAFKLELAALRKARTYYKNIQLILPFVRTPDELTQLKQLLAEDGLYRNGTFKIYVGIDVPANLFVMDQLLAAGVDGVWVDARQLAAGLLSLDMDNPQTAHVLDEGHDSVLMALEQIFDSATRHGLTSWLYSSNLIHNESALVRLLDKGLSGIIVGPESADLARRRLAEAEFLMVKNRKLGTVERT